jgi:hypothetical protein
LRRGNLHFAEKQLPVDDRRLLRSTNNRETKQENEKPNSSFHSRLQAFRDTQKG